MNHQCGVCPGTAAPAEDRSCSWQNPWVFLVSALAIKTVFLTICIVMTPFTHITDQPTSLQQKFMEWWCISAVPQDKGRGWMCCPRGWKRFQGSCYYLSDDMMGWAESKQNCTEMGSHLVVINSEAEQDFLTKDLKQSSKGKNYYIGLSAQKVGQWQWVDQTPLNETAAFWRTNEPSNVDAEMCVVIHAIPVIDNWNDVLCERHYRICEAAAVTV
ncbi:C-type lectin domain family 6 member A-like [Caloenas nicobarica]|uniref:C-type lectin domain family 6 member A-like n=1 Tax=Caloenas nicobarica TaxID=187106 RepID=UPI0032B7EE9E